MRNAVPAVQLIETFLHRGHELDAFGNFIQRAVIGQSPNGLKCYFFLGHTGIMRFHRQIVQVFEVIERYTNGLNQDVNTGAIARVYGIITRQNVVPITKQVIDLPRIGVAEPSPKKVNGSFSR